MTDKAKDAGYALAAINAGCYTCPVLGSVNPSAQMAPEWYSRTPNGAVPELFDSPKAALVAAAIALGLTPVPVVTIEAAERAVREVFDKGVVRANNRRVVISLTNDGTLALVDAILSRLQAGGTE